MVRKLLSLKPNGFPCKFVDCPPGFFMWQNNLCMKSAYFVEGHAEAYNEAGEMFWGDAVTYIKRDEIIVEPCEPVWIDDMKYKSRLKRKFLVKLANMVGKWHDKLLSMLYDNAEITFAFNKFDEPEQR